MQVQEPLPASPCRPAVRCAAVAAAASLPPPDHAVLKVGPPQLSAAGPQLQLSRWLWPAAGSGSVPAARQPIDGRWTEVGVLRPATSFTWHLREKSVKMINMKVPRYIISIISAATNNNLTFN